MISHFQLIYSAAKIIGGYQRTAYSFQQESKLFLIIQIMLILSLILISRTYLQLYWIPLMDMLWFKKIFGNLIIAPHEEHINLISPI